MLRIRRSAAARTLAGGVAVAAGAALLGVPAGADADPGPPDFWSGTVRYVATQSYTSGDPKYHPGWDAGTHTWSTARSATFNLSGDQAPGATLTTLSASGTANVLDTDSWHVEQACPEGGRHGGDTTVTTTGSGDDDAGTLELVTTPLADGRWTYRLGVGPLDLPVPVTVGWVEKSFACDGSKDTAEETVAATYHLPEQTLYPAADPALPPSFTGTIAAGQTSVSDDLTLDLGAGTTVVYALRLTRVCASGCGLTADAGGPYTTTRAAAVSLHGSSTGGTGASYAWSFSPGASCPPKTNLRAGSKHGGVVGVKPLCDLVATLTVTDSTGRTARDTARVTADERSIPATRLTHEEQPWLGRGRFDPRTPRDAPLAGTGTTVAQNVSRCSTTTGDILCPYRPWPFTGTHTRLGHGYTLATVHDPGGPFDGFSYVATATMQVRRRAVYNPAFAPGGPPPMGAKAGFYAYNKRHGRPVDAFRARIRAHEGPGTPGNPLTGHTGVLRAKMAAAPMTYDPNRAIERLFGPTKAFTQQLVDLSLSLVQAHLLRETRDPLPEIWSGRLYLWDAHDRAWTLVPVRVGGAS